MSIEKSIYQIRNWKAHWRAFYLGSYVAVEGVIARGIGALGGRTIMEGAVALTLTRAHPKWWQSKTIDYGVVSKRVVTTAGVNYMRDDFNAAAGGADISLFKFHGCGVGVAAEAIGDVALGTESTTILNPASTRATGSQAGGTSKTYVTVGTLTFTGAGGTITEHGIFSTAGTGTGTLWDRSVFAAVNVVSGDSIQFTYTLTISDGG